MNRRDLFTISFWGFILVVMFGGLIAYSSTPGTDTHPPTTWPQASTLQHDAEQWTLVLFAHPRCPCTQATLAEFARLQARSKTTFRTTVVLYRPAEESADWVEGSIREAAKRIEGVKIVIDPDGQIAKQFRISTSGHILAYASDGQLGYSGGLTTSRGHEGRSQGAIDLEACLQQSTAEHTATYPVFGCALFEPTKACESGGCAQP